EAKVVGEARGYAQRDAGTVRAVEPADDRTLNTISAGPSHEDSVAEARSNAYQVVAPTTRRNLRRQLHLGLQLRGERRPGQSRRFPRAPCARRPKCSVGRIAQALCAAQRHLGHFDGLLFALRLLLIEFAARKRALLLVVGTHGCLSQRPTSIIAGGVSRSAPCPVVVVPDGVAVSELSWPEAEDRAT